MSANPFLFDGYTKGKEDNTLFKTGTDKTAVPARGYPL